MLEALAVAGSFACGIIAGAVVPWGQLKKLASRAFPKRQKTNDEDELAQEVLRDVREHVVAETIRLRDMAKSDDPLIEDAMRAMAKSFLVSNRRFFQ